jgi:SNF2 family DNA or RNA helicase
MACELAGAQRRLYNAVLRGSRRHVLETVDTKGMARARLTVLAALLRLRQVCCDPQLLHRVEGLGEEAEVLLDECVRQVDHRSAKLQLFHELVREIVEGGHRVLVFSQFVRMLELLRAELERSGLAYEYLDGSTKDRLARVDRFNAGSIPVFLLSLKAGGTGLNLTGADYVIHYDPWWNPAVEAQATDRAHRIGQTKPVFSYKLIARGTIEERMLELHARKRALAAGVLDAGGGFMRTLTREDLEFLLGE